MDETPNIPKPPDELTPRGRGRRFWREVLADHELRCDELQVLREACRQLDLLDRLQEAAGEIVLEGGKLNPCIVEARLTRQELRRSLGQLQLPDLEEEEEPSEAAASYRTGQDEHATSSR